MKKVKVTYHDYPSIDEINAFILFGYVTTLVKPTSPIFSYWELNETDVEIQETSREEIEANCEHNSYEEEEQDCIVLKLTFDTGEVLNLIPDAGEQELKYYWDK